MKLVVAIILVIAIFFLSPHSSEGISTSLSELEDRVLQLEQENEDLTHALYMNTLWDCRLESVVRTMWQLPPYEDVMDCLGARNNALNQDPGT